MKEINYEKNKRLDEYLCRYYSCDYMLRFNFVTGQYDYEDIVGIIGLYLNIPIVLGEYINLSINQKQAFRDALADYIWETINNESENLQ